MSPKYVGRNYEICDDKVLKGLPPYSTSFRRSFSSYLIHTVDPSPTEPKIRFEEVYVRHTRTRSMKLERQRVEKYFPYFDYE